MTSQPATQEPNLEGSPISSPNRRGATDPIYYYNHSKDEATLDFKQDELVLSITRFGNICKLNRKRLVSACVPFAEIVAVNVTQSGSNKTSSVLNRFRRDRIAVDRVADGAQNSDFNFSARGDTVVINYLHRSQGNRNKWSVKTLSLTHEDHGVIFKLASTLRRCMEAHEKKRPKRLLVFINPYGGKGKAREIFHRRVVPLFNLARISYEVIETERANHAHDLLLDMRGLFTDYDGVVCVGGDGMFNELFNGLIKRVANDNDVNYSDPDAQIPKIDFRIGVIPGGSTDALVLSLHGAIDVETAALHIILGDRRAIDVNSVFSDGVLKRYSMTMVSYGYFGDVLSTSERFRYLGPKRYDLSGADTFLRNKGYEGIIGFVKANDRATDPENLELCTDECDCREEPAHVSPTVSPRSAVRNRVEGRFVVVTGACTTCSCEKTPRGVSPGAHLSDGNLDLILVRHSSRLNLAKYLLRTSLLHQSPFDLPFVEVHRVKEFSFTHFGSEVTESKVSLQNAENEDDTSIWNCDGEILDSPNIHVKAHHQLVAVFGRGPEKEK